MTLSRNAQKFPGLRNTALAGAAGLAVLAVANYVTARRTERRHRPKGHLLTVDGVRLHYTDRGIGRPVVLLHGNAVSGQDFDTSGVAEALLPNHRVIVFDRPGFGHSARPRGRAWTAAEQAELLHKALIKLRVHRPVVAGHSWGTLVALHLALIYPADVAGLMLLSGYYFPSLRLDVPLVAPVATPVLGDILRYTVSPVLGWLSMPAFKRMLFSPARPTARFQAEYSPAMALRPSQIRATAMDGVLLVPGVTGLDYGGLAMPVAIMAGRGDKIVANSQAERLHAAIPGSTLRIVEGVGHMVHHLASHEVAEAIAEVQRRSDDGQSAGQPPEEPSLRAAAEAA